MQIYTTVNLIYCFWLIFFSFFFLFPRLLDLDLVEYAPIVIVQKYRNTMSVCFPCENGALSRHSRNKSNSKVRRIEYKGIFPIHCYNIAVQRIFCIDIFIKIYLHREGRSRKYEWKEERNKKKIHIYPLKTENWKY